MALAYAGRLREGTALLRAAARHAGTDPGLASQPLAWYLAAAGDLDGARRAAGAGVWFTIQDVMMLGQLGEIPPGRALLAELRPGSLFAGLLHALLARSAGDAAGALTELRPLDRHAGGFVPYYHGLAAAQAGFDAEAVEALGRFDGPLLLGSDGFMHPWLVARARYVAAGSLGRLGRAGEARAVLEKQLLRWKGADRDLPLLAEMKALCRKLGCEQP